MEMKDSNTNELEILDEEDPFGDVTTPFDNVIFSNAENGVTTHELSDKDIIIESSDDDEVMQKCETFLKKLSETLPFNDSLSAPQVSKTKVKTSLGVQDDKDKDENFVSSPKGITKSLRAIRPYTEENLNNKIDNVISLPGSPTSEKTPDKNDDKTNSGAETVRNENHDIGSDDEHSGEQTPASNILSRNKDQRDEHSRGENPNSSKNSGKDKSDSETSRAPSPETSRAPRPETSRASSPASVKNSRSEARQSRSRSPSSENQEKEEIVLDDSETSESESEDSEEEDEESTEAQERWEKRNTVEYDEREDKYYRKNKKTLEKQLAGKMTSCTSCCSQVSHYVKSDIYTHPVLGVLLCKKCAKFYGKGEFKKDADGYDEYCRWCANGGDLLLCDNCSTGFCKNCIKRNLGRSALKEVTDSKTWKCYTCSLKPLVELRALQRTILEGLRIASSPRKGRKSLEKEPIKKRTKKTPIKKKKVQTVDESSDLTHAEDLKILLITFKNQLKVIEKRTKAKRGEEAKVKLHRRLLRLIYLMQQNFTRVRNEIVKEFGDIAEGDQINTTNTKEDASKEDEDGEKPANEEEERKTVKSVTDSSENNKIYGRMRKRKLNFEEEEERSSVPLKKQKVQNDDSEEEASSNDQGIVEKEMSSKGKNMKRTSVSHNDSLLEKEANKSSNYSQKQTTKKANANISDDDSDIPENEVNKSSNLKKTKESISDDDADIPEKEANKSSNHPRKKNSKKAKASISDNDSDISENEANTSSNPRKAKASINDDDSGISEKEANKSSNYSQKRTQKKEKKRVSDDDSDIPEKEANKSSNYSRKRTPKKSNESTCDDDSDVPENEVNKSSNPRNTKANISDDDSDIPEKEVNKSSIYSRKQTPKKANASISDDDSDVPEREMNKSFNFRKQTPKKTKENKKRNFSKGDSEEEEKSENGGDESSTDESPSKTTSNLSTRQRSNSVEGKFPTPVLKRAVISLTPVQVTQMNIENSSEGKIDGKSEGESEDSMSPGVNRSVKGSNNIRTSNKTDSSEEKKVKNNKRKSGNRDEDKRERERTSMFRDRVPESNDSDRKRKRQQDVITLDSDSDSDSDSSSNDSYDAKPKKESKSPQSKSKKSPQNKTPVNRRKSNGLKIKAAGFFGNKRNSTEVNGTVVRKKRGRPKASGGTNKRMKTAMVTLEKEVFTLVANKTKAKTSPAKHKNLRSKSPKVRSPRTKV